ncbi:MAG: SGNH/GDSL hydrolase family protein [Verrucomicrobiota bacterium]
MKRKNTYLRIALASGIACLAFGNASGERIDASDARLSLTGAPHAFFDEGKRVAQRFPIEMLELPASDLGFDARKGQTSTGCILAFQTDSPRVKVIFEARDGENRGSEFGVFEEGELVYERRFAKSEKEMVLEWESVADGMSLFEVSLPSWSSPALVGLEIQDGSRLKRAKSKERKYVAFGDSISHGTGQGSASYRNWPFLLSRKFDVALTNLAVGGGKVSGPAAEMLKDMGDVDLITLLIGYNDLNTGISPMEFSKRYTRFLETVEEHQPRAKIYCISLLYTKRVKSRGSEHTVEEFRKAVVDTVSAFADKNPNVRLIHGDRITSERNLRDGGAKDVVHLSVEGASMFADAVYGIIAKDNESSK